MYFRWSILCAALLVQSTCFAQNETTEKNLEELRMDLMRSRALSIRFETSEPNLPASMEQEPLFRYDDIPRGYVDGTVWRWGKTGRPLAIITTELHPKYLGSRPSVVYDYLSLSEFAFAARSKDTRWSPSASAVEIQVLENGPKPAKTSAQRRFQMKRIMQDFSAAQIVTEEAPDKQQLNLRLLPRPIEVYQPMGEGTDGAIFLFVAGRMPGVIVVLETDGNGWQFGVGRLSAPSTLTVSVGEKEVYRVPPSTGGSSQPYLATNAAANIPGY